MELVMLPGTFYFKLHYLLGGRYLSAVVTILGFIL